MPVTADRATVLLGSILCGVCLAAIPGAAAAPSPPTQPAVNPPATRPVVAAWPAGKPSAPAELPGSGLGQHDFLYAGEAKTRDIYIVRKGQVTWAYHDSAGRGEISDATLLSDGNVLFAHQFGVTLISPDKKVIWNFDAPDKSEIHTAQAIGSERVLFIENGPAPKLLVINIVSGTTEKEMPLTVKNPKSTHGQFRHARLTDAGTLLVAHMDLGKVVEYDEAGKELWSTPAPNCWAALRLKNGNTLITSNRAVREVNPAGETVWQFTPDDVPDYRVAQFQIATRLPNGNTLVNNWVNQWNGTIDPATAPVQAWEITPDKKVAWALRSWTEPAALGPSTTIQILDDPGKPEDVHFGQIK
jgi:hypothetical protein